jgi:hypothetical protein
MRDLSVIIPARHEIFLQRTIEDVLANAELDTEVIAICDGYWPDPPIKDHPKVTLVHHTEAIGQRAATNEGARISRAKHIMKLDAHCAMGKGFDRILIADCLPDYTIIPAQWNLHAFNWECESCGHTTYQGTQPELCEACRGNVHKMVMVWKPRRKRVTYSWRFDKDLHFQYWKEHSRPPECQGDLSEAGGLIGAGCLMLRDRFWELGGLDEAHGSWGQFGTEIACKTWLSGGKLITSKKTWFAHLFRTANFKGSGYRGSSFPYPISDNQIKTARAYSQDFWANNRWDKAKYPLEWLIEKFKPVPDWHKEA